MRRLEGAEGEYKLGELVLALTLNTTGAGLFSAGLVLQRYSLSAPSGSAGEGRVRILCCTMTRNWGWALGLALYTSGNCVYTVAMQFAPVSLLTTCFAIALPLNAVLSRSVMGESIDRNGAVCYAVIMLGIAASAVGLPKEKQSFSAGEMTDLVEHPAGAGYMLGMAAIVVSLSIVVWRFERQFPFHGVVTSPPDVDADIDAGADVDVDASVSSTAVVASLPPTVAAKVKTEGAVPGSRLFAAYLTYGIVLSSYETIAQLCLKAGSSMLLVGMEDGETLSKHLWTPIFVGVCALGAVCTVAAVIWLRFVYRRFDTATMFPVEYSSLIMSTNVGGIVLFREHMQMSSGQWVWVSLGGVILLLGMGGVAAAKYKQRQAALVVVAPSILPDRGPSCSKLTGSYESCGAVPSTVT